MEDNKPQLHPNSAEKKALSNATLAALTAPTAWKPRPPVFHPRPDEVPENLRRDAEQVQILAKLLREKALKTMWAFNAAGFTFPHELDVILTDLERKADQLFVYLKPENYQPRLLSADATDNTGRNGSQTDSTEADSEDRREETK